MEEEIEAMHMHSESIKIYVYLICRSLIHVH